MKKRKTINLTYGQVIPFWGIYPKDSRSTYLRDSCQLLIVALFTVEEWIKTFWYVSAMELFNHKEERNYIIV